MNINELVLKAHENAKNKGFWDKPRRETGTLIALIHSEVAEALDADSCANFCEELSDICIRIFDLCGGKEINLEAVIRLKDPNARKNFGLLEGISVDASSFSSLEKSMMKFGVDLNDDKHASKVNRFLSYALESDRKKDSKGFALHLAMAFLYTLKWAAKKGYSIEGNILAKMEKNSQRPRLHGKAY